MTMHVGLAANAISTDAVDARLALAGLVIRDVNGVPRNGVFPHHTYNLIGGRSDMAVNIYQFAGVISRGPTYGAILFGNDGTVTVALDPAPTANSRIDHIYIKHPDVGQGDTSGPPFFGVVKGEAGPNPVAKAVPDGAMSFATVQIPSSATTTSSANVVINVTYQYTNTFGSPIYYRTAADMAGDGAKYALGTSGYLIPFLRNYIIGINNGTTLWVQRNAPTTQGYGLENTSGGLVNAGATSSAWGARNFTAYAAASLTIYAKTYVYTASTNAIAGQFVIYVDGVPQTANGQSARIHSHGRAGWAVYSLVLQVALDPGNHSVELHVSADPNTQTMEVWDAEFNYMLTY